MDQKRASFLHGSMSVKHLGGWWQDLDKYRWYCVLGGNFGLNSSYSLIVSLGVLEHSFQSEQASGGFKCTEPARNMSPGRHMVNC